MNNDKSFYDETELLKMGFRSLGKNVNISRNTKFYNISKITIGSNVRIDDFCILSGEISLGSNIHIASGSYLFAGDAGIVLDDFSGLSSRCALYAVSDDYSGEYLTNPTVNSKYRNVISKPIHIGKHVDIGTNTTVLPGVSIGEGSAVYSMSLVNRNLKPYGLYFGVPCKRIGERSKNIFELEREFLNENQD